MQRLSTRHLEQELVSYKSNQSVRASSVQKLRDIDLNQPELATELAQKKSLKFNDPSKHPLSPLNMMPRKMVRQVVTPKVLRLDKQACRNLVARI